MISRHLTYVQLCSVAALLAPMMLWGQEAPDQTRDKLAIRQAGTEYVDAFNKGDAKTLASFWSPEGIYVNRISGEQVVGRDAIAAQFNELFAAAPDVKMAVTVESIQFVSPNVAVEHGIAGFLDPILSPKKPSTPPSTFGAMDSGCSIVSRMKRLLQGDRIAIA